MSPISSKIPNYIFSKSLIWLNNCCWQ